MIDECRFDPRTLEAIIGIIKANYMDIRDRLALGEENAKPVEWYRGASQALVSLEAELAGEADRRRHVYADTPEEIVTASLKTIEAAVQETGAVLTPEMLKRITWGTGTPADPNAEL